MLKPGALVLALLPAVHVAAESPVPQRPNLLLIMAEDLGPRIGAYGDEIAHTPNIDALAREGVRYTRAFTSAGVCAPSRAAIIMGVHPNAWGAGHMRSFRGGYLAVPPPEWKAFPELLRAAGYYSVNNGKTDYQMGDRLGGSSGGPSTLWDEGSGDDWRGRSPDQPFFAYLTLLGTHESQVWPTWRLRSFMQIVLAPMRIANHLGWEHEVAPQRLRVPRYYPDTPTVRSDLARHYNNIAHMDRKVGEILARLEADGLADSTVVIFTTDHGDGLPRAKRWLYDSGIHVPLVVRWPDGRHAGETNEELVSLVDLAPTLLALAGAPRPAQLQGRVFMGPAREPEPSAIFAARDRIDEQPDTVRAVRDRRFKYIRNLHPELPYVLDVGFRNQMPMMQEMLRLHDEGRLEGAPALWFRSRRDPEELYDTLEDPEELHNLALDPAHEATRARLAALLDARLASEEDLGLIPESELRERFWPGGEQPRTAPPNLQIDEQGRIVLRSPTRGASVAYRTKRGAWKLYSKPLGPQAAKRLTAKAVRYGWQESGETEFALPPRR